MKKTLRITTKDKKTGEIIKQRDINIHIPSMKTLRAIIATEIVLCSSLIFGTSDNKLINQNTITYSEEINEYNNYIKEYSEEIKSLELNDLQTIMKVIKDTWESIDGYKVCDDLVFGYYRLSFYEEEKIGVCTSFADDFTAKMNEINPLYNARNIVVYLDDSETADFKVANIERTILGDSENDETNENSDLRDVILTKLFGNHMVSAVDIPGQNITLIVDSTNPAIGIFKSGKIYIFNCKNSDELINYKVLGMTTTTGQSIINISGDYLKIYMYMK